MPNNPRFLMARKGSLSAKTFFPNTGDQFVNEEEGIFWECVRSNSYIKDGPEVEGKATKIMVRYALLEGVSGDETLYWAITDQGEKTWLANVCTINRRVKEDELRGYEYNSDTKTWQEVEAPAV